MRFVLIPLCLYLLSLPVASDDQLDIFDMGLPYFTTVGKEDSVPLGIITALAQDSQGLIWIGSQKGLVKFDGYQFTTFTNDPDNPNSISGDFISALWTAPDGKVWIGTRHDGVSIYDSESNDFSRIPYNTSGNDSRGGKLLSNSFITAITGDRKGNVWIGTRHGLNRINAQDMTVTQFLSDSVAEYSIHEDTIGELFIDREGTVWAGTEKGIARLVQGAKRFNRLKNNFPMDELAEVSIQKIFRSHQGPLWVGTNNGGVGVITPGEEPRRLSHNNELYLKNSIVYNIDQPVEDEIWVSTYGEGIYVFDANTTQFLRTIKHDISIASSLNSNSIGATLTDQSGLFWIGTWGGGLNLFNPFNRAFSTLRHSPTDKNSISIPDVLSVLSTQDNDIWIGTRGSGIDVLRPGEGRIAHYAPNLNDQSALQDGLISALYQTSKGDIWVGSRVTGAFRFRKDTDDFKHYTTDDGLSSNVIKRIIEDKSGNLWFGTEKGLDRFDPLTGQFNTIGTQSSPAMPIGSHVNALAVTNDGALFAGASNGLYRLKPGDSYLQKTNHNKEKPNSLSHNMVLGLFVDNQQSIWASTAQGLDRLVSWQGENAEFESISTRVGYPNQALWGNLQYDRQGRIWDGKNIIDLSNNRVRELTKADGVDFGVNWYAGYHKTKNGTLLYVGSKGLLMVKPELFQEWNYQPPVIVTKLLIDNKPVSTLASEQVTLSPQAKSFRVEFSALDYSSPESLQYAFRLKGYDEWRYVDASQRAVSYTNLAPNTYMLEIKATNRNGSWSERKISLPVVVLPAWYQKAWFQFVLVLCFAVILYLLYALRVRKLHQDKRVLESQVDLRTQELEESHQSVRTLSDIGLEISSTLNLDKILNTVYERVNQLMDANVFWIGFYEETERRIVFKLAIEKGKHLPQFSVSMDDKNRYAVWCVANRKPIVINDKERDRAKYVGDAPQIKPVAGEATASIIYWPLEAAGKIIGTISVQSFEPNAYNDRHLDIIKTLASTTAIVMDNAIAYEKAQRAAEVKSAFMANMSHEIRTPMNGILGMTRLIKETKLDANQKEYIDNIDTSAKTLLTIINDILDFSKVESGKLTLEQSPFSLTGLIKNVAVVVETLANEKGLNFNYQICRETPADFIGDPTRINQILLNLCSNAVKFTEKGEVNLLVTSTPLDDDQFTLKIDVIDQGIGIDEKVIPKLFSSFSQADASTTRKYGGTGLGLVISQQLAHKMNGNIKVKSIPQVGSCFSLTMRLPAATMSNSNYVQKTKLNKKANVMVIDQDEVNRKNISQAIGDILGCRLGFAANADELRQALKAEERDVFLVSLDCPPIKLKSMFNLLVKELEVEVKKIIVYTNHPFSGAWLDLKEFDISQLVSNPFSSIELKQAIRKVIRRNKNLSGYNQAQPLLNVDILIAEDNQINQLVATKMLAKLGANVEVAVDGTEAVKMVRKKCYDIVLMDIQMPKMDGTKATMMIRNDSQFDSLPIIAMTANVLQNDIDYYLSHGMNDHISKPIRTKDLLGKISEYIDFDKT